MCWNSRRRRRGMWELGRGESWGQKSNRMFIELHETGSQQLALGAQWKMKIHCCKLFLVKVTQEKMMMTISLKIQSSSADLTNDLGHGSFQSWLFSIRSFWWLSFVTWSYFLAFFCHHVHLSFPLLRFFHVLSLFYMSSECCCCFFSLICVHFLS